MSILTRFTAQHLDDAALAEVWTNAVASGARAAHPHLDACPECRVRYASFTAWLDEVRADAISETDAVFTSERLAAQQAQILRRIEATERPTRVIAFPKAALAATRPSSARRWVAGAAAAGLIAGIGLGQLLDLRHLSTGPSTFPADRIVDAGGPNPGGTPARVPAVATVSDDAALADIEAMATPRYETLRAFDTLTPRAADFLTSSR